VVTALLKLMENIMIKKVKLYYDERFEGTGKFPNYQPTNLLKENLKGKTITLGVHDKNGKLLKSKSYEVVAQFYFDEQNEKILIYY